MSVLAAKLIRLIYGDIYLQEQNESKQKRPPWQEVVFRIARDFGRLSPQGGDLVQRNVIINITEKTCYSLLRRQILSLWR